MGYRADGFRSRAAASAGESWRRRSVRNQYRTRGFDLDGIANVKGRVELCGADEDERNVDIRTSLQGRGQRIVHLFVNSFESGGILL